MTGFQITVPDSDTGLHDLPGEHQPYFPELRRVVEADGGGSWIEPQFDESWSELVQLRWSAAVLRVDAHVQVSVNELEPGRFGLSWDVSRGRRRHDVGAVPRELRRSLGGAE